MVLNAILSTLIPPRWRRRDDKQDEEDNEDIIDSVLVDDSETTKPPKRRFCWGGKLTWTQLFLSSGSDADIVTDWLYYFDVASRDTVPGPIKSVQYLVLLLATVLWLMQVTGGRCCKRVAKKCFGFEATNRNITKAAVICEDIPQVILTILNDVVFSSKFSLDGIFNLITSGYDGLQKIKALMEDDIEEEEDVATDGTREEQTSLTV